jgi:hypothetical protein
MFGALEALSFEHLMQWLDHLVKCFDRGEDFASSELG